MNNRTRVFYIGRLPSLFCCVLLGLAMIAGTGEVKGGTAADFDGDGKADISVFRPSDGFWYVAKSSGGFSSVQWGLATDYLVPGDYDGDGKTDLAVYRSSLRSSNPSEIVNNNWYILRSSDNSFLVRQWGTNSAYEWDTPAIADYDGDGKTDLSVYTLSDGIGGSGRFKILQSSNNSAFVREWGVNTDLRIPADYDGDGRADLAVYRARRFGTLGEEINIWYILQSSTNTVRIIDFGLTTDWRVPADYDGDGKADIAVFRPSNGFWYRINSRDNSFHAIQFGLSDDILVPADYDGDGKTDIAVWRPSTGIWYLQRSTAGFTAQSFGANGDFPIPNRR